MQASIDNLIDGKDGEWGERDNDSSRTTDDADDNESDRENQSMTQLPEPEMDMHWHLARYLPETRNLRAKFQTVIAGYLLSVYTTTRNEHRRIRGLSMSSSSVQVSVCSLVHCVIVLSFLFI